MHVDGRHKQSDSLVQAISFHHDLSPKASSSFLPASLVLPMTYFRAYVESPDGIKDVRVAKHGFLGHLGAEVWHPDGNGKVLGQVVRHSVISDVALCKVKSYPVNPDVDGDDTRVRYLTWKLGVENDDVLDDVRCGPYRLVYVLKSGEMDQDDILREK